MISFPAAPLPGNIWHQMTALWQEFHHGWLDAIAGLKSIRVAFAEP
jgi:hypothetical protein